MWKDTFYATFNCVPDTDEVYVEGHEFWLPGELI